MGAVLTLVLAIETCPARISAFSRERDNSGRRAASTRSSRGDPSLPATVTSNLAPLFEDEPCSKEEPCFKKSRVSKSLVSNRLASKSLVPKSLHDRNCDPPTDPRAGRAGCTGAADDADRGPDHGPGDRGRADCHRLSPFPLRGKLGHHRHHRDPAERRPHRLDGYRRR